MLMTRPFPWWAWTRLMSASCTCASLPVRPGDRMLVESLMNRVTPSLPAGRDPIISAVNCSTEQEVPLWPAGQAPMSSAVECSTGQFDAFVACRARPDGLSYGLQHRTIDAFVACRIWQSTVLHLLGISRVWDQADASLCAGRRMLIGLRCVVQVLLEGLTQDHH